MIQEPLQTYEYICFSDLVYEYDGSDSKVVETKIRRRLKYHNLAAYDQARVDYIRNLRNDLRQEILLQFRSKYYQKSETTYADLSDFNLDKMASDFLKAYPKITDLDMVEILKFAIYIFYMR